MRYFVASWSWWSCFVLAAAALAGALPAWGQTSILVGTLAQRRAEVHIRDALSTPVTTQWFQHSLGDVLADLGRQLDTDVKLDTQALESINITAESLVRSNVRGVTARAALDDMLRSLDPTLTWTIWDETLTITTREAAQERMQTRVYPVGDLVVLYRGDFPDFDPLIELFQKVVEPASWDAEGGPGAIEGFAATTSLVVTQTRDVHERIEGLLEVLRQVHGPGQAVMDAYVEAMKEEGTWDEARGLGFDNLPMSRGNAPLVDASPALRVPQHYEE